MSLVIATFLLLAVSACHSLIGIECRRITRRWAREHAPHLAVMHTRGCTHQRRMISMFFADQPPTYAEISASLSVPVGSIGPTRCRLLGKVRDALTDHEGRE